MTATDIKIASNALLLLGHEPISSFEEPTAGAQVASNLYESTYDSMLTTYRWRFASKKVKAARLAGTPLNDFSYKYQIPSDCLYLIKTSAPDYEIFEDKIFCNDTTLDIEYTYKVSSDGLPAYYVKALEFFLASQFAIPITGDINKANLFDQAYAKQSRMARHADATQRPSDAIAYSPYTDVRD